MRIFGYFCAFMFSSVAAENIPLSELPVVIPVENQLSAEKRRLGKILFWDEQLSSDNTVACGSCHIPGAGGAEPSPAIHPGSDNLFNTADDIIGSAGIRHYDEQHRSLPDPLFGFNRKVTGRASPSFINTVFAEQLFWDGRASSTFIDPLSNNVVLPVGGALESQSLAPILNDKEMAKQGRTWSEVIAKLETVKPLFLARDIPQDIQLAVDSQPDYPSMFERAFGNREITPTRIAMALATYQRTLISDQAPWDKYMAGDTEAMTSAQISGWEMFNESTVCGNCHTPPLFSDNKFHNIGLRPAIEDIGREEVTQSSDDFGRFKTSSLRNAGLRPALMHTGWVTSVRDGIDFYNAVADAENGIENRHHQFTEHQTGIPTQTPDVFADYSHLSLASESEHAKNNVADFIANALTDPRVANEEFPFDRPKLASERQFNPSNVITFMTYNVAGSQWDSSRVEPLSSVITSQNPTVIGMQEAGSSVQRELESVLPNKYQFVDLAANSIPIVYDSEKLFLLVAGTTQQDELLWCVNDRYVSYAIFTELETGSRFAFFNSHLCSRQTQANRLPEGYTAEQVNEQHAQALVTFVNYITQSWQIPYVIAGDLNADGDSSTMRFLFAQQSLGNLENPLSLTDSWEHVNTGSKAGIDWLLIPRESNISVRLAERVINVQTEQASDHHPVIASVIFNALDDNLPSDTDNDGVNDDEDALPLDPNEWLDSDNDGVGNNADTDDDNDGVNDNEDAFPLAADEWLDTDNDGIGNNADTDDDGDGVKDNKDAFPLDASKSSIENTTENSSGGTVSVHFMLYILSVFSIRLMFARYSGRS